MPSKGSKRPRLCPIRVVCRITGLKQDTVRAWEKRYGAINPERSPTRRRLYSNDEIERLILLRRATEAGWRIGEIARLPREELEALIAESRAQSAPSPTPRKSSSAHPASTNGFLDACFSAVQELDAAKLVAAIERSSVELSRRHLVERVLTPLMHGLGDHWEKGELRPAHEHLATSVIRSFLGGRPGNYNADSLAPHLLITTPTGQIHELGALLAAAFAEEEGWRVTYLGPSLPAEEIAYTATHTQARAVGLGITRIGEDRFLEEELRKLRRLLPDEVTLAIGGQSAAAFAETIEEIGAELIGELEDFHHFLERLGGRSSEELKP